MTPITFDKQLGFSHYQVEFVNNNPFLLQRFSENNNATTLSESIISILQSTNKDKTEKQTLLLDKLNEPCRFVVTGQQPGLFGGPMYSLLKACTAVSISKTIERENEGSPVVPIFWIEDNDHDLREADFATISSNEWLLEEFSAFKSEHYNERTPIGEVTYPPSIAEVLGNVSTFLQNAKHKDDLLTSLHNLYKVDTNVSQDYLDFLQLVVGELGILFIKASDLRKAGLFKEVLLKEISNIGETQKIVEATNRAISQNGFLPQAVPSTINCFIHLDEKRHKITELPGSPDTYSVGGLYFSQSELLRKVENNPDLFSPSVLLRPLVQDFIFHSHTYVAGPGELAYLSQLKELYQYFEIPQGNVALRHSATFVPTKISRFVEKQQLNYQSFFQPWETIEHEFRAKFSNAIELKNLQESRQSLSSIIDVIRTNAKSVDQTLEGTVNGLQKSLEKDLQNLEKKIVSALQRKESELFTKYRDTSTIIYPKNKLQERVLSPIFLLSEIGFEQTRILLEQICVQPNNAHYVVSF